jgi:hypothetical protein
MGLLLSIGRGNTLDEWAKIAQNNYSGIIGEDRECHTFQGRNSLPCLLVEIQITIPQRHPSIISALEPVLVDTIPGEAETFNIVIDIMSYGTDFKLVNILHVDTTNHADKYLNTSINEWEIHSNIDFDIYDILRSRGKPGRNRQHSYCTRSVGIFDEFLRENTTTSVGLQIAMQVTTGFKSTVTATLGFDSIYHW